MAALLFCAASCDEPRDVSEDRVGVGHAPATVERADGRLLVLRLGDGVEVLRNRPLRRAPRPPRGVSRHWKGRWEVRSGDGRVLSAGRFRIPRRRHALFGDVGGPARAVDVTLERPVVWLRIRVAPGARTVVLYDDHGRRRLGEVTL
jgi:hypothetical protein